MFEVDKNQNTISKFMDVFQFTFKTGPMFGDFSYEITKFFHFLTN